MHRTQSTLLTGYYWFSLPFSYCSRHFQLCGLHLVRVKCVSIAAHFRPKENWFLRCSCSDVFFHENYLHWTQFKCFHWTRFDARVLNAHKNQQINRSTLYPKSLEFHFERTWRPKHRIEFRATQRHQHWWHPLEEKKTSHTICVLNIGRDKYTKVKMSCWRSGVMFALFPSLLFLFLLRKTIKTKQFQ